MKKNLHALNAVFRREFKAYFASPLGYVFLVIFLFALGHATFEPGRGGFFINREASLSAMFSYIPTMFLFLIPAISMRLWAEERKSGSIEFLMTLPLSFRQAILGKFYAGWLFVSIAVLLTFPMVITVSYLGAPDAGAIFLGYLGAILMGGSFLAIGCFFSAATNNQVISFILSVVFCYLLTMAGSPPFLDILSHFAPQFVVEMIESLSLLNHYEALQRGVLRLGDVLYYLIMIVGWLWASHKMLEAKGAR